MPPMHPLLSATKLAGVLDDVRVVDIRWDLTDRTKGRQTYREGHIPGAVFADLDSDLADPPGVGGRHPLPTTERFAATLGDLGITPETHVVVCDDSGGRIAVRLWWMLRAIGHDRVQVLDGGYQAWTEAGGATATGDVTPDPTSYPTPERFAGALTHDQLQGRVVVDARAGERYRGEIEPVDPLAGHIPGAINIPTAANLDETGRFHDASRLATIYEGLPANTVVSCGSGVTACHDALAMVVAGSPMPDVYVGSFSEWSRLDLPVHTGPDP